MDLARARQDLAADLSALGTVRVATNPKHAQAPCVLVGPITEVERDGGCAWQVTIPVWLIAPAPGDEKAVDWLGGLVTDVIAVCGDATAVLGSYDVGQGPLPAYEITALITVKE